MAQVWPVSLPPAPLRDGFQATGPNNVMRTQMEVGPAKTRKRGSVGVWKYAVAFAMDDAQLAAFFNWFAADIGSGAEPFEFRDPITGNAAVFRFEGPYGIESIGLQWRVSATWELMPS